MSVEGGCEGDEDVGVFILSPQTVEEETEEEEKEEKRMRRKRRTCVSQWHSFSPGICRTNVTSMSLLR